MGSHEQYLPGFLQGSRVQQGGSMSMKLSFHLFRCVREVLDDMPHPGVFEASEYLRHGLDIGKPGQLVACQDRTVANVFRQARKTYAQFLIGLFHFEEAMRIDPTVPVTPQSCYLL